MTHLDYFIYQDTNVQSYIFEDHPILDEPPYNGDRENYFPTI